MTGGKGTVKRREGEGKGEQRKALAFFSVFIFIARRNAKEVLAVVVCLSVCVSVFTSVCLSQAGIVSKRLHI